MFKYGFESLSGQGGIARRREPGLDERQRIGFQAELI
jgi:hypothetical protein